MPSADKPVAASLAASIRPHRRPDVLGVENSLEPHDAADLEITPIEIAHEDGMFLHHMERARFSTR
jgi:hypothetical protein